MSLELALKENTEALLAHTAAINKLLGTTASVAASTATSDSASTDDATTADTPKRERGKPSPGKSKRTAAEVAEDKAADEADAAAAAGNDDAGDEDEGVTFEGIKTKLGAWLGEFAVEADKENPAGAHPEVLARKAALKAVLNKLTGSENGKLGALEDDAEKIGKLDNWFETKAKVADKGFGIGRLAADPEPAGDEGGNDELDI